MGLSRVVSRLMDFRQALYLLRLLLQFAEQIVYAGDDTTRVCVERVVS
jgi:hypothetical protein